MHDLIIIGSGPAGMTAAIYAARAELDTIVIEQNYISGGQVINTYEVDNYPGFQNVSGMDLCMKMREHCDKLEVNFVTDSVTEIRLAEGCKEVVCGENTYEAKTVIIASGADHAKLGLPGENEFGGRGVSYCATCDGAFFRQKDVAVIGGGNIAIEDAIFLSNLCRKVYVVHRRDELRAEKILQSQLFAKDNVEMVWNSNGVEIAGDAKVASLTVKNKLDETERTLAVDGVFVAVGITPNSSAFAGLVDMDEKGFIIAGEDGRTNVPGIYAAGDVRTKALRQIITACGDGANCVKSAQADMPEL